MSLEFVLIGIRPTCSLIRGPLGCIEREEEGATGGVAEGVESVVEGAEEEESRRDGLGSIDISVVDLEEAVGKEEDGVEQASSAEDVVMSGSSEVSFEV